MSKFRLSPLGAALACLQRERPDIGELVWDAIMKDGVGPEDTERILRAAYVLAGLPWPEPA